MKISGTGFLSPEGRAKASLICSEISEFLELSYDAVRNCHNSLELMSVLIQDQDIEKKQQQITASIIQVRLLEIAESIIYLAQGGFNVEITASFRNFLEAYFIYGNVCSDPKFESTYLNSDLKAREKIINASRSSNSELFSLTKQYATDDVLQDLKSEIKSMSASEINVFNFAKNIGCEDIYNGLYRISSAATHSTPRSLSNYINKDNDNNLLGLNRHPQADGLKLYLLTVSDFLLNINNSYHFLFDQVPSIEHSDLLARVKLLEQNIE